MPGAKEVGCCLCLCAQPTYQRPWDKIVQGQGEIALSNHTCSNTSVLVWGFFLKYARSCDLTSLGKARVVPNSFVS